MNQNEYYLVEKRLKDTLEKHGWRCYSVEGKNKEDSGIPDVLAFKDGGVTYHFECKLDTELSLQQVLFLKTNKNSFKAKLENKTIMLYNLCDKYSMTLEEFIR